MTDKEFERAYTTFVAELNQAGISHAAIGQLDKQFRCAVRAALLDAEVQRGPSVDYVSSSTPQEIDGLRQQVMAALASGKTGLAVHAEYCVSRYYVYETRKLMRSLKKRESDCGDAAAEASAEAVQ